MPDIAATIEARSTAWMNAWVARDCAVLEDSLAPDFALIVSAMPERRMERDRWLATCDHYVCTRFAYRDVQVRELAPGLAVMSAVGDQSAAMGDVDRSGAFFLTDVWRLESDDKWRVCARYSAYPEPVGASSQSLGRLGRR